jgi:hypothetical protein
VIILRIASCPSCLQERVRVRVDIRYIPLTFVLSPERLCRHCESTGEAVGLQRFGTRDF